MEHLKRATATSILLGLGSTIQGSVSLLSSFLSYYFSAPSEHFPAKSTLSSFRSNSRRGTSNSQKRCGAAVSSDGSGGSSCSSGSDCISGQYCFYCASVSNLFHTWIFSDLSLQFPAGDMQLTWTGCYSLNSTPVATKLGPVRRGECQLSFALFFSSIRAFSAKRTV
jgi:hypothetical protein